MNESPTQTPDLGDAGDRITAVATFDRNLVVTAGAGTGKTTLLIDRLIHLLVRNPEPMRIIDIAALTFTNKAADEMRARLRERLQGLLYSRLDRWSGDADQEAIQKNAQELLLRYQLSKDELDRRIQDALRNLERADIGTIHSFAANLLRLYPLEAGVDPQFHEDDGAAFDRLFDELWDQWLDKELRLDSAHAADWRIVLARLPLGQIKALARSLAAENVNLRPPDSAAGMSLLSRWLATMHGRAADLIARHPEDRLNEKLIRAAHAVFGEFANSAARLERSSEECALLTEKAIQRATQGWSPEDAAEAQDLVRAARGLVRVDGELTGTLWRLLVPYAENCRERFLREGHLSFDALLVRARDLVRDHRRVREDLQRRYRAILVDEFQDTDPIQYEVLLYLAEKPGRRAVDWRQVEIEQGKIFVVGDPKQSIYAFRRADIEAYLEVVEKIIKAQDGVECRLTTNFRSNPEILDAVNGLFTILIRAQDGLQPPYIAIHPAPGRSAPASRIPKVLVRKIAVPPEMNADAARHLEGQSLARWLKEEILGNLALRDTRGETAPARAKDVAILLRKLTDIHDYLEPLRRQGIRYVVEGERHFYAAKEIIDAVNLLRAVGNPHDRLALVGVLRSPLGGLTDQQIYELHRRNLLDCRSAARLGDEFPPTLARLYDALTRLNAETRSLPIGAAVSRVFATLPLELLAAASFHGEQAVANLKKLAQQAEILGAEGTTTLNRAIRQLEKRVLEVKDEGESALAEESLDAVRVMSIHKAKGLEFPIVVLAGCQGGIESARSTDAEATFDWSTGLTGLRIGSVSDLAGLYISEKSRRRSAEEQKRLLYVAMTRAREHLIISCAPTGRRSGASFLAMLDGPLQGVIGAAAAPCTVPLGRGAVEVEIVRENPVAPAPPRSPSAAPPTAEDWQPFIACWARRAAACESAERTATFVTPTALKRREQAMAEAGSVLRQRSAERATPLMVGDLAHRFLQRWDFTAGFGSLDGALHDWLERALAAEPPSFRQRTAGEVRDVLGGFLRSQAYAGIAGARILGREVPLIMPWNGSIMEGIIDLIYERDGLLYLADYKTDRIAPDRQVQAAERYRLQAEIYWRAAAQALGREPAAFQIIFLRIGAAVALRFDSKEQLDLF